MAQSQVAEREYREDRMDARSLLLAAPDRSHEIPESAMRMDGSSEAGNWMFTSIAREEWVSGLAFTH